METAQENPVQMSTLTHAIFTTLREDLQPFRERFAIYSKTTHYDQICTIDPDEQIVLKKDIEKLGMDADIRSWLYKAMQLKKLGKKILFLTDRMSLMTYKRSVYQNHPGLWDMVLCEHDMRHDRTKDVTEDYGEKTSHDGSLDVWFRNRVHQAQIRMFIKVAHGYPEVWNDLIIRDGQEVEVYYNHNTLHVHILETHTTYTLAVGRIRLT